MATNVVFDEVIGNVVGDAEPPATPTPPAEEPAPATKERGLEQLRQDRARLARRQARLAAD